MYSAVKDHLGRLMRLWHLSPSVNSIFKHACAVIHWGYTFDFWSDPSLLPYFMCVNGEGSGETARMHSLALAFAARLCNKVHKLMSWLISKHFDLHSRHINCLRPDDKSSDCIDSVEMKSDL